MVAVKVGFGLALTITLYAVPFSGAQAQQAGIPAGAVTQEQNSDLPQPEGSPLRIDFPVTQCWRWPMRWQSRRCFAKS